MHTTSRIMTVFCPVCRKRGKFTDARPIYMDAGRGSSPPIPLSPSPSHSPQPQSHSETNAVGDRERTRFQAEINRLNTHLRESQDDSSALRAALEAAHVEREQLGGDVDTLRGRLDMLARRSATQLRELEANVAVLRHDAAQVGPLEEEAAMARAEVMRLKEVKECLMREMKEVREREGCWRGWVEEHKKETMKWKGKVKGMKEQLKRIERERENERNRVKAGAEEEIEEESLVVLDAHEGGLDPIKKVHKAKGKDNEDWLDELWIDGDANDFAPIDVDENSLTEEESVVDMDTGVVARPPYFVSARDLLKTGSLDEDRPLPQDRPRSFVRFPSDWTLSNTDGKGGVFDGVASGSGAGGGTSVALSNNAAKKA
ncbi:hypothetical protein SERLA73DRAFT_75697 [Serpula lacrymans var. lacrymans S7.3]|uniref:Uncharacterized protein n=1 Tax=Serpula lacrymans var. lacrymans (strain S7.3) TaxID=936435 RepID=F8Q3Z1_SERL3|nr:hypothetical protein SERLA73DRAFT_75697 [Serpula lacrymans var. lacrymans S7.3]